VQFAVSRSARRVVLIVFSRILFFSVLSDREAI